MTKMTKAFDKVAKEHGTIFVGASFGVVMNSNLIPDGLKRETMRQVTIRQDQERQLAFLQSYLNKTRLEIEEKCRESDTPLPQFYDKILAGSVFVGGAWVDLSSTIANFGLAID